LSPKGFKLDKNMKIDLKKLINFVTEANKAGYASGQDNIWKKQPDGSTI